MCNKPSKSKSYTRPSLTGQVDISKALKSRGLTDIEVMVEIDGGSGVWLIPATYLRAECGAIIISTLTDDVSET